MLYFIENKELLNDELLSLVLTQNYYINKRGIFYNKYYSINKLMDLVNEINELYQIKKNA